MGHLLTSPLQKVSSLSEAKAIMAELVAQDAAVPFAPKFFDLLGQAVIAVFPSGECRQGEIIAEPGTGFPKVVVS